MGVRCLVPLVSLLTLCVAMPARAQTNLQLWGNMTLDWGKSDRLVYELDFEPKVLLDIEYRCSARARSPGRIHVQQE
jgi:hypothetical protein